MFKRVWIVFMCVALCAVLASADVLKLRDGSTIEGRVIDQGTKYWIKDTNGETRTIEKNDVVSWQKGSTPAATPIAPATPSVGSTPSPAAAASPKPTSSPLVAAGTPFATVKSKADACETPIVAVALWQSFIDNKPATADLDAAKGELKKWQDLVNGNAEKINGKWIAGEERTKLIKRVRELIKQGNEEMASNHTLQAIDKFEQAVKLYPNNFDANFTLGYFNLVKGVEAGRNNKKIDDGVKSLEMAVKLKPDSAAALSDLAIGYHFHQKYKQSVLIAYKAAKIEDSKGIVQNLVNSIAQAPEGMQRNDPQVKPIMQEALILASKYGIGSGQQDWVWVLPHDEKKEPGHGGGGDEDEDGTKGPPGIFANGTGFLVSPDGFILTNRHVAKAGDFLMVKLADGTQKIAERIVVSDDEHVDIAVIRIKTDEPLPFVRLAAADHPATGADLAVFGFPLLSQFGLNTSVKMTNGIVTSWDQDQEYCDVTTNAQVNPGNSGGPIVDMRGNLLAMTAMKTLSNASVSSYGLGIGTGRIRKFIADQQTKVQGLQLRSALDGGAKLTFEEVATKLTPCTVCIFCCRGTPPTAGGSGDAAVVKPD